jgi:hypothetical protein
MTVITNTVARVFIRWSLCLWKALCLLIVVPLSVLLIGVENTEIAPHLHYTNGCDRHHLDLVERSPRTQQGEAPAYWAGALSLGEELPQGGQTLDRTFELLAKLRLWLIGRYLWMMASSCR